MKTSVRVQWALATISACITCGVLGYFLDAAGAIGGVIGIAMLFAGFGTLGMDD